MESEDGQLVIGFNGEIYNYQAIREVLTRRGLRFRTNSDTEVILQAWKVWGPKAVEKFNGIFAFALLDKRSSELFLVRDRYGTKPLYLSKSGDTILFASEQRAILAHPSQVQRLNLDTVVEYMTFQNIFTNQTFNYGIELLAPGTYTRIDIATGNIGVTRYWDYDFNEPNESLEEPEYIQELVRLFEQAVKHNLVSDTEIGSYLSGGMDTAAIVSVASQAHSTLKTFSIGFAAETKLEYFDESDAAQEMADYFKTDHTLYRMNHLDMERLTAIVINVLEEPRVGQSYPNFQAAKIAQEKVKVILSGTGGDELFGGYPWRYFLSDEMLTFPEFLRSYFLNWQRLLSNKELQQIFAPIWREARTVDTFQIFSDVFNNTGKEITRPEDYLHYSMYFEARTFLHGLLVVEDKLSMNHGLETRVPFLDNDLVDFATRVPARLKVRNSNGRLTLDENFSGNKALKYTSQGGEGKLLLRRAMEMYLPNEVTKRKKIGFSSPDEHWFRSESRQFVIDRLLRDSSSLGLIFDTRVVKELVNEHLDGTKNRRLLIWSLLSLEQILRDYV